MTLKEIVKQYLDDNGFDGLCGDDCIATNIWRLCEAANY